MFEGHFGLRENPFVAAHQSRYIYPSPEHQEALAHLRYGIENREPFVLITGEVGTGKTTALFDALSEWEGRAIVGLITNSSLTRAELLEEIALRLGMTASAGASKPQIMVALERHLLEIHREGLRAILLLDEAQNLERELLEEIRLLSNLEFEGEKLVQIFLVGQPELEGRLQLPDLRQLRQRIAIHYRLRPLGPADAERYIHHRITVAGGHALSIFPSDACAEVHRLTNGIPREMNHLCSQSMVCAFVEGAPAVTRAHVQMAAHELEFQSVLGKERRTRNIAPAVERRQGPTIPGAAPPPEREMHPAKAPGRAGAPAAPSWPERSGAPDEAPPSVSELSEAPPSVSELSEAPAEARPNPPAPARPAPAAAQAPEPHAATESEGAEAGPPAWHPADLERRAAIDDVDGDADLDFEDAPDGALAFDEDDEADDAYEDDDYEEDADDFEDGDDEAEDDLYEEEDEGPETGPPRLGAADVERGSPQARPGGPPPLPSPFESEAGDTAAAATESASEAEPDAPPVMHVPSGPPPAPAASGDDWQSWFKSLARDAEDVAHDEGSGTTADEATFAAEFDAPGTAAAEPLPPATPPESVSDAPAPVTEPPAEPRPAAQVTEADSTSAFAAALRRAQAIEPPAREEATTPVAAAKEESRLPRDVSRPARRLGDDASFESLPPRLREKMAQQEESPRESSPVLPRILIAAVLLLIVVAGAVLAQRMFFAPRDTERAGGTTAPVTGEAGDASAEATPAVTDSKPDAALSAERPQATPPESGGADRPEPAATTPTEAPPAEAAPPPPTFVLAVGTYLNETRAKEEQSRLSASTPYEVTITTVREDNAAMYRVTLRSFPSRDAAERAASDLISRGQVDEARVLALRAR